MRRHQFGQISKWNYNLYNYKLSIKYNMNYQK